VSEPIWIETREAIVLHERLLALHGGAVGVRDPGLLESVLNRPRHRLAYAETSTIIDLAALYTTGVVRNHPFADGNKRTGFVIGILFLELNGYAFSASEEDAAEAVLAVARGDWDEDAYAAFLAANAQESGGF
jgi:death-on-curing protein